MNYSIYEYKGDCPICDRPMYDDNNSINRHHFIPKSRGGKTQEYAHRICHDVLHRTFTNKELEKNFSDPIVIKENPEIKVFIEWVKNKNPLFYQSTKPNKNRGKNKY